MPCSVYGLFYNDGNNPVCIYVGTTKRDPDIRLKEHKREARRGKLDKPLYFFLRRRGLIEDIYIEVLQTAEAGEDVEMWEDEWVKEMKAAGQPILNAKEGNAQIVRPKNDFAEMYKAINEAANQFLDEHYV